MKKSILAVVLVMLAFGPVIPIGAQSGTHTNTVYWSLSSSNASYNLYRSTTSGAETKIKSGLTGTTSSGCPPNTGSPCGTVDDIGLAGGTVFFYQVSGVSSAGVESTLSAETSCKSFDDAPVQPVSGCKAKN